MGLGLSFAEGEGPRFAASAARRGRRRAPRRSRHGAAALRLRCRRLDPQGARRQGAADRLRRQPVDARLLHGRGRGLATTTGWSRRCSTTRPDLLHRILADQRRGGRALPERADRRRRAGGDDLRQLGRRPRRRRLPGVQPRLHAARAAPAASATPTAGACRTSSSPRAAGRGWKRSPRSAPMSSASTGPSTSARRAGASAPASRCRATSTRRCCSPAPTRSAREVAQRPRQLRRARPARTARNGHVFNLGHGISQHTPPESVAVLVDAVHDAVARATTRRERDRNHERPQS